MRSLLVEILSDEELRKRLKDQGFIINIDYPTKDVKLHRIVCRYSNPDIPEGMKPSSKRANRTGEIWFSDNRDEAELKAKEIAVKRGYHCTPCNVCQP